MPANRIAAKRPYGSGCLFVSRGAGGTETWFGKWRVGGRQVKRRIGPKRAPGSQDGLTKAQAGRHLTEMIAELKTPPVVERVTVGDAGRQLIRHREWLGRKRSTLQGYDSFLRIHLVPYFGERSLERIGPREVEAVMCECRDRGQSVKSTLNYVGLLHGIFDYALRRGWVASNPCKLVDKPRSAEVDPDIRFLDQAELDALLAAVPDDYLGRVERTMYRAAAMTGMARASCWPFAGWTLTGRRGGSGSGATSSAVSSERRSRSARHGASRSRTCSGAISIGFIKPRRTKRTKTSCSRTRTPAGRWTGPSCSSASRPPSEQLA